MIFSVVVYQAMPKIKPTESELQILQILWNLGPSTVKTVHEELSKNKDAGYTTTLKIMQIMHEKSILGRIKDGRTHVYHAMVTREDTQKQIIEKLLNTTFKGSAAQLVMQALGSQKTSEEELDQIRKFLDEMEGGKS
jgi:predicted transcriptional regulator